MNKIMEIFMDSPEEEFHVRQISKLTKKSPTTISKYLKKFEKEGILRSKEKLNHLLFKANTESNKFKQLKIYYNIKKINNSGLIEYLKRQFSHSKAIVLFGSFAKGENISKSDIDLLIISPSKKECSLERFEKTVGSEIQLFIKSPQDIGKMKKTNPELLNNFVNGITIDGFLEVFR